MPELPEVEALARFLDSRTRGRQVERVELGSFAALKTVQPPITELVGKYLGEWERRGKYLCLGAGQLWMVFHLGRAGWVTWYQRLPETRVRPRRSPIALRVGLGMRDGESEPPGFDLTEAGKEKRLSIWMVHDPAEIPAVAGLGIDPMDPALDDQGLAEILARAPGTTKSALTNQSLLAGIGNAYSDEVCSTLPDSHPSSRPVPYLPRKWKCSSGPCERSSGQRLRALLAAGPISSRTPNGRRCGCTDERARPAQPAASRYGRWHTPADPCSTAPAARPAASRLRTDVSLGCCARA